MSYIDHILNVRRFQAANAGTKSLAKNDGKDSFNIACIDSNTNFVIYLYYTLFVSCIDSGLEMSW